jgi:hypothetical protein
MGAAMAFTPSSSSRCCPMANSAISSTAPNSRGRTDRIPWSGLRRIRIRRPYACLFNDSSGGLRSQAPRVHPKLPVVWVLNELSSTVNTCSWDARTGVLHSVQDLSALPEDFKGENTAAEIAVSAHGATVYCSNRGVTERLKQPVWTPSDGKSPRYIGFDPTGTHLFAANEQGDNIATFRADPATGALKRAGDSLRVGSAVTIALIRE